MKTRPRPYSWQMGAVRGVSRGRVAGRRHYRYSGRLACAHGQHRFDVSPLSLEMFCLRGCGWDDRTEVAKAAPTEAELEDRRLTQPKGWVDPLSTRRPSA